MHRKKRSNMSRTPVNDDFHAYKAVVKYVMDAEAKVPGLDAEDDDLDAIYLSLNDDHD